MRVINSLWVAVLIVAFALPAIAKNDVVVQGDLLRDGFLTINLDWQVDTKRYKGVPRGELRERVKEDMYKEALPQLVKKTDGLAVSYDKSNFTKLSENVKLVKTRNDGTEVYDVDMTYRFSAPCQAAMASQTKTHKQPTQDQNALLLRSWNNTF
jgi:hypothetical protein